jgi:hypothetical protein
MRLALCLGHGVAVDKIMLDTIYIGLACGVFVAFLLYAIGCQKL